MTAQGELKNPTFRVVDLIVRTENVPGGKAAFMQLGSSYMKAKLIRALKDGGFITSDDVRVCCYVDLSRKHEAILSLKSKGWTLSTAG